MHSYSKLKNCMLLLFCVTAVAACGDTGDIKFKFEASPIQEEFVKVFVASEDDKATANVESVFTEMKGKLPHTDLKGKSKDSNSRMEYLLSSGALATKNWRATVSDAEDYNEYVVVQSVYLNQQYTLFLFEAPAKAAGRELQSGDEIQFSGAIHAWRRRGLNPDLTGETEFQVYPTALRSKNVAIVQSPEGISREIEKLREAAYAKVVEDKLRAVEDERRAAEDAFRAACRETIKEQARYPESVSFSWLKGETGWENDSDLMYKDVVKSKNGFGNVVPVRFVCTMSLRKKDPQVRVVFLD